MKRIGLMKGICYACVAGGLASKLFIPNALLGSILGISLLVVAVVILGIAMQQSRKQR